MSLIYTLSRQKTLVPKVPGARDIYVSDIEFRYQIIVYLRKILDFFAEFMIPIALFKKFLSLQFIASVEVSALENQMS